MATIDHLYVVDRFPSADSENRVLEFSSVVGGPAGRGSIAAARLGGRVKLFATCGNDGNAVLLKALIEQEDIEAVWLEYDQPSQQSAIVVGRELASRATFWLPQPMADERALSRLDAFLTDVDVVLLDSTDEALTKAALDVCERRGLATVIDTGSGRPWAGDLLPRVDHVICPEKYLLKQVGSSDHSAVASLADTHCRRVFGVTTGAAGGRYVEKGARDLAEWSAAPVAAVDTCGAGDTFHGAYTWAIGHGYPIRSAFNLAAWSAGLKVAQTGNSGIPTLEEAVASASEYGLGHVLSEFGGRAHRESASEGLPVGGPGY